MFTKIEWLIAKRYLKTNRKESFITLISWVSLIGITLGVAVLIIVMSVMNGFKKELIKSIVGIDGHLTISNIDGSYIYNYDRIKKVLTTSNSISNLGFSINTQALISTVYYSSGVIVKALTLRDVLNRNINLKYISVSDLEKFKAGEKVIFIGKSLARSIGVNIGDSIKVVFPQFSSTAFGVVPRYVTMSVGAVFTTGMFHYDSNMVIIPLNIAQIVFNTNGVKSVEVFINNPEKANIVREQVYTKFGGETFISTWQENNLTLITALNTERNVMFIILFLIIMVATFNIMSGLVMLVRSKTKEIAILMAIGFNSYNIQKIFLIIGLRTGFIGTVLGTTLGVLFSLNIENIRNFVQNILHINVFNENVYFLSKIPAEVSFLEVTVITSISIILSVVASIYPAKKASSIIVAQALHYE